MAKLKTHKSTLKRFKVTKKGKISYTVAAWNHLRSKKNARVKYRKVNSRILSGGVVKNVKKLIPGINM